MGFWPLQTMARAREGGPLETNGRDKAEENRRLSKRSMIETRQLSAPFSKSRGPGFIMGANLRHTMAFTSWHIDIQPLNLHSNRHTSNSTT